MTRVESYRLGPFANTWLKGYRLISRDLVVDLIDHGATVTKIAVPDRTGAVADVLLGCDHVGDYLGAHPHFNCIVGRYANRITNARFELDGEAFELDANLGAHQLHGGADGLHQKRWASEMIPDGVRFWTSSPHLEAGFPGNLDVEATYRIADERRLLLTIKAQTDRSTPVSLTAHHYYNLAGERGGDVLDHEFEFATDRYLPVSSALTQLGEIRATTGTPFDFSQPRRLRTLIDADDEQMQRAGGGFDHHFVLPDPGPRDHPRVRFAARACHPPSGRWLEVATNQPGFQFYTANSLDADGKGGVRYARFGAFCIETQQFPDAPNQPAYPDATLRPGETFEAVTVFEFGCS